MIELNNISKSFNGRVVFRNLTMLFDKNRISCILGPSGCGKTTLLNVISNIEKVDSGQILGIDRQALSYIFQELILLPWKTVYDNVAIVLEQNYKRAEADKIIKKYIELVDLQGYENFYPSQLSVGMRQRVVIARAFAYSSEMILMDEPFSSLDFKLKNNIMGSFGKIWENDKRTVIFVTHDIEEAILLSDKIFVVSDKPMNIIKTYSISKKAKHISGEEFRNIKLNIINTVNDLNN